MAELYELVPRFQSAMERRAQLVREDEDWRRRWDAARDFNERTRLAAEDSEANRTNRILEINGELAHLKVLLDLHQADTPQVVHASECKPAFAMTCDEVLDRLYGWAEESSRPAWVPRISSTRNVSFSDGARKFLLLRHHTQVLRHIRQTSWTQHGQSTRTR